MRRDLVDIPGRETDPGRLSSLSVSLEAEAEQRGAAGIIVTVELSNGGADDLPLLNPFEFIQFQVRDVQGYPRHVPSKPPRFLVHRASGDAWTLDSPLPIQEVRHNGESVGPAVLDTEILNVEAGGEWRVALEIDRFIEGEGPSTVEIPDGVYEVGCLATLIDAERRQTSRIVQSGEIKIHFARQI